MIIKLKLYASLQHYLPTHAQRNQADIEVGDRVSLNELIEQYHIPAQLAHLVLVNGVFISPSQRDSTDLIKAGDTVAIWPPVAGG